MRGLLTDRMMGFAAARDWTLLAAMLPLGIGFGAIHALMPGHGKTLIASYLLGSRLAAVRSLLVSSTLSLTHVGSAVLLTLLGMPLLSKVLGSVGRAPALETLSRSLLIGVGIWLLVRAARGRSHHHDERNGILVGATAGLIPCPLTVFAMALALSRGVPEAGLVFALAMMIGVGLTLALVALMATFGRGLLVSLLASWVGTLSRCLEALSGLLILAFAAAQLMT